MKESLDTNERKKAKEKQNKKEAIPNDGSIISPECPAGYVTTADVYFGQHHKKDQKKRKNHFYNRKIKPQNIGYLNKLEKYLSKKYKLNLPLAKPNS